MHRANRPGQEQKERKQEVGNLHADEECAQPWEYEPGQQVEHHEGGRRYRASPIAVGTTHIHVAIPTAAIPASPCHPFLPPRVSGPPPPASPGTPPTSRSDFAGESDRSIHDGVRMTILARSYQL